MRLWDDQHVAEVAAPLLRRGKRSHQTVFEYHEARITPTVRDLAELAGFDHHPLSFVRRHKPAADLPLRSMHRPTVAIYDESAEAWTRSRRGDTGPDTEPAALAAAFRARVGGGLIVDLGCGPGRLLAALGPAVGFDASFGMLHLARKEGAVAAGDLEHLPIGEGTARGAFGLFSFQHLTRHDFPSAVAEVFRVLAPGGWLYLAMHQGDYEGDNRPHDDFPGRWFTYWTATPLHGALQHAGFVNIATGDQGDWLSANAQRPTVSAFSATPAEPPSGAWRS